MTHSQYLLPALPDLLKSHRLSYKKFLHNGIDEEFDLLSAKTELNEEEIFYESLKLNHIDELSPSQVESLDYIYHAEEKIFLIPKRTLEDSLRGRQSHSFHLFIPLEVKILPFQDELDPSHFEGSKFLEAAALEADFEKKKESTLHSGESIPGSADKEQPSEFQRPQSTPQLFFRGGSGSPLSETRKEFFQTALTFFFQQPKIQKLLITKRFLLLRWFCEKLQYLEPTDQQTPRTSKPVSRVQAHEPALLVPGVPADLLAPGTSLDSGDQFDLIFAKFDLETKTKLYQIYQSIILKFEKQTQKRLCKTHKVGSSSSQKVSRDPTSGTASSAHEAGSKQGLKPASKKRIKLFQKTSGWGQLISQLRGLAGVPKLTTEEGRYPQFPHFPGQTVQNLRHAKKLLQSQSNSSFNAFDKNSPSPTSCSPTSWGTRSHQMGTDYGQAPWQLPGFHFKTIGLTAGRQLKRSTELPSLKQPSPANSVGSAGRSSSVIRFGRVENTKVKSHQKFAKRSLRSTKLVQRVKFIRRIVHARGLKNQKKKLQEIFLSLFPVFPEKKGLRFWKIRNLECHQPNRPVQWVQAQQTRFTGSTKASTFGHPTSWAGWSAEVGADQLMAKSNDHLSRPGSPKGRKKLKFLKHFKNPLQQNMKWERQFHFLSPKELQKILKQQPTKLARGNFNARIAPKFLSLPQHEMGSLWKVLPKMTFQQPSRPVSRVQAQPTKWGAEVGCRSGVPSLGAGQPISLAAEKDSVSTEEASSLHQPTKSVSIQCYQLHKLAYRQRNMFLLHANANKVGSSPVQNGNGGASKFGTTANLMGNTKRNLLMKGRTKLAIKGTSPRVTLPVSRVAPTKLAKPHSQLSAGKRKGTGPHKVGSSVNKPTFRKKLNFDRFFLKSKERQALHWNKSLELREKVACRIEKKFAKLRLLPGLAFWEKSHSEKRIEEYWESLLQPYRQKIPSKLFVSVPSGSIIFVKSEKDSAPKRLLAEFGVGQPTRGGSLAAAHEMGLRRNESTPGHLRSLRASKGGRLNHSPKRFLKKSFGNSVDNSSSYNQKLWVFELMNMKFLMKRILTYSPALLEFYWKYRFRFLWKALSEPINLSDSPYFSGEKHEPTLLAARENLPKVCSDLRKLLATFHHLMFHERVEPQKFFVSGQVAKKEWPFQKDGSKSYFALLNLGKMPFMTKQGHFLINGSPRVLVSQIAKCPNFYTKMKIDSRGRPRYWTEFVSSFKNAGEWIQFHIDLENKMFFSLGTKRKYSIFIFLGALGISPSEIPDVIEHWDFLKQSIHKEEVPIDQNENFLTYLVEPLEVREARVLFHDTQNYSFFPGGEKTDEELQKFFEDIFYNPSRYFLGHAGREALNQRRRFSGTPSRSRALEKEDFLAAINALIEVRLGLAPPDDIDHLKFRRVRLPGELLQNEFHLALEEIFTLDFTKLRDGPLPGDALESQPKDQRRTIFPTLYDLEQKIFEKGRPFAVSKTVGIQSTYQVSPLEKRMRNFFHTGQLSQYMDQTNPLAEITHKRRLTSLGPDGLPKQVGVAVRELHPSHFGRICPIETPEGLNAGLVASLSSQAKIGSHHTLLAPYYWVKDRTREFPQKIFYNQILAGSRPVKRVAVADAANNTSREMGSQQPSRPVSRVQQRHPPSGTPLRGLAGVSKWATSPENPLQVFKYPPVLPEVIFLSASAEDSVYICSEDYWFSSKYKNFETIADSREEPTSWAAAEVGSLTTPTSLVGGTEPTLSAPTSRETGSIEKYSQIDSKNALVKFQTVFPARYQQEFFTVTKSQIDFFAICPTQMISVGTSLIPFLEHDDANRALMGSNMQRQALPLLVLERPLVGTGSEKGVAQSSNSVLLSEFSGQVSFADGRKIVVDSFPKKVTSFPEPFTTKNSRLLLPTKTCSSEFSSTAANEVGLPGEEVFEPTAISAVGSADPLAAPLDFGHRNLFQKFQNRTEDGKVKTMSRIFTVKMKLQTDGSTGAEPTKWGAEVGCRSGVPKAPAVGSWGAEMGSGTRFTGSRSTTTSKFFTAVKVFPISDEEYEKSRNLLRREFLKKYKEIQNKTVFPADFWPGERWKKTGDIWKLLPTKLVKPANQGVKFIGKLGGNEVGNEVGNNRFPSGSQKAEEIKRIRYKKANLGVRSAKKRIAKRANGPADSSGVSALGPIEAPDEIGTSGEAAQPTKWGAEVGYSQRSWESTHEMISNPRSATKLSWNKAGAIRSHVRKFSEKTSPTTMSHFILKKKTLRRSLLPLKAGGLFFEPTPKMIFKNILSKNSKKREILRKAFLQKAFIPQRFEFTKLGQPTDPSGVLLAATHEMGVHPRAGISRSKVSWSVSMKKVTPYTQVTYNIHGYWRTNQNTLRRQRPAVRAGDWVAAGDLLADSSATLRGELCVGQNILVGYVPWEGYNFEDAIVVNERLVEEDIYTSILIDRYEMEAAIDAGEKITRKIPDIKPHLLKNLDLRGIICVGTWVEEDDILVGKILPVTTELQGYSKLLADIYQIAPPVAKDVSFRVPDRISGRVLECSVSEMIVRTPDNQSFATPWKVTLYLVEKRRMKLGDKMSGRHGNKGIVSIILPPQDMPFLPDGTPLDVALNPLGVPSRMNVGQLLESLLGLAGKHLHQKYRIPAFDEMYGEDFSRRIVYDKLLEASQKTQKPWLFNPNFPGKMMLRDGRTGEYFHQPILVGYPYMLKLIHMVDDKMHARATGPYTMVTQQPLKGRANRGGQRIGEMEVWAVEAFAASYALQELLTLKSDDITGRNHFLMSFLKRKKRTVGGIPDAFRVLMHELQSLCFHVHYTEDYRLTYPTLLESSKIPETPIPGNYGRG